MRRVLDRLVRAAWDLRRFGLTPSKLAHRLTGAEAPHGLLAVSLPKAGTHLLERTLCLHPGIYRKLLPTIHDRNLARFGGLPDLLQGLERGQLLVAHLEHAPERVEAARREGVRCLFMIRDPRDIAVSQVDYIVRSRGHYLHPYFRRLPTVADRIRLVIRGVPEAGLSSFADRLRGYSGWLEDADLVIRFEELIGPRGGGQAPSQEALLVKLFETIGLRAGEELTGALAARVFSSSSPTFHRGAIGRGREILTGELGAEFRSSVGDLLELYGYSPSAV